MNTWADSLRDPTGASVEAASGGVPHRQTHVLAVGPVEHGFRIHDALLREREIWLSIATDACELWTRSPEETIHVIILCETLSRSTLEACSRCIRQRWPAAKILVIHADQMALAPSSFDERLTPDASLESLMLTIENLAGRRCA
jgi:hypothetical protein